MTHPATVADADLPPLPPSLTYSDRLDGTRCPTFTGDKMAKYGRACIAMAHAAGAPAETAKAGHACENGWIDDPHDIEQGMIRCPKCAAPQIDATTAHVVEIAGRIFGFKHWKQDEEQKARWEQFAAEIRSATAPDVAKDATLFKNVTGVKRTSDQSVQLVFTSCNQASVFERAAMGALPAIEGPAG